MCVFGQQKRRWKRKAELGQKHQHQISLARGTGLSGCLVSIFVLPIFPLQRPLLSRRVPRVAFVFCITTKYWQAARTTTSALISDLIGLPETRRVQDGTQHMTFGFLFPLCPHCPLMSSARASGVYACHAAPKHGCLTALPRVRVGGFCTWR